MSPNDLPHKIGQMLSAIREKFFTVWAAVVTHRPRLILVITGLLVLASMIVTVLWLGFQSNRNDLISDKLEWNRRFIQWTETFTGNADLVIVVDTQNRAGVRNERTIQNAQQFIDAIAPKIEQLPDVAEVTWGYEPSLANPKTIRLLPMQEFDQRLEQIRESRLLLQSPTPAALIQGIVQQMQQGEQAPQAAADEKQTIRDIRMLAELIDAFTYRMQHPVDHDAQMLKRLAGSEGMADWKYLQTPNGRLFVIRITPQVEQDVLAPYERTIHSVRQLLAEVGDEHPQVDFGLTGIEVIEGDETEAFTRDATYASILAAVLIALLLVTALHGFRTPILLMVTLGVGIAWSFGFLTLVIGHLQVISVVFTAILLGLGVGFGIHLTTRYQRVRKRYPDTVDGFNSAIADAFNTMGPGVMTGALTTAGAFCTTLLTDFRGVAEMGAIAAMGVVLCMVAMFTVLPSLMRFFKQRHHDVRKVTEQTWRDLFDERWAMPFSRHPVITLVVAGVLTVAALAATTQMRFDNDLMALMPEDVPSVEWGQKIMDVGGESVYFGVSIVDSIEQAREEAEAFLKLPTVESVGGVGRIIPQRLEEKNQALRALREQMSPALQYASKTQGRWKQQTAEDRLQLVGRMRSMRLLLGVASLRAPQALRPALGEVAAAVTGFLQTYDNLDAKAREQRLAKLYEDYAMFRQQTVEQIRQIFDFSTIDVGDLPPGLLDAWVAETSDGRKLAIEVYPKVPEDVNGPLDPRFLGPFIEDMRSVDPTITGVIVQIYESGRLIWTSYVQAGIFALIVVLVLVYFDFQSIRDALLSLLPVAVGFAITFGIMYLIGMQINPANIIVLPLMFGIGVDAGVHMIHRHRMNPQARPLGLSSGTGKAISLTSYTTMIGFGSMMIASHRGIVSLGVVLTIGLGLTLLACWTVMPAMLELRSRSHPDKQK